MAQHSAYLRWGLNLSLFLVLGLLVIKQITLHRFPVKSIKAVAAAEQATYFDFPTAVGNAQHLDFYRIENLLAARQWTSKGLAINADTLSLLEQVHAQLPAALSPPYSPQAQRIEPQLSMALSGALGEQPGSEFAQLLTQFSRYRAASLVLQEQLNQAQSRQQQVKLLQSFMPSLSSLQEEHFDATKANQLFGHKNLRQAYSIERRLLSLDTSLSSSERQRQLLALKEKHTAELSSLEREAGGGRE